MVFADSFASWSAILASVWLCVFFMISAVNNSAESSIPAADCNRVPAPGIKPVDMAVVPKGVGSCSRTNTFAPDSFAANAAQSPQAPAPTMTTGTSYSNSFLGFTKTFMADIPFGI